MSYTAMFKIFTMFRKKGGQNKSSASATSPNNENLHENIEPGVINTEASVTIKDLQAIVNPKEWDLMHKFIIEKNFKENGYGHKITRKELKKFAKEKHIDIPESVINHSFLIFKRDDDSFDVACITRKKQYEINGVPFTEKNLGKGSNSIVVPVIVRNSKFLQNTDKQNLLALKCVGDYAGDAQDHNKEKENEITILKKLDRLEGYAIRHINNEYLNWEKTYILQKIAPGICLELLNISEEHKLQVALCCAKQLQELHDKGVIHCDVYPRNFMVHISEHGETQATIIDFDKAKTKIINSEAQKDLDDFVKNILKDKLGLQFTQTRTFSSATDIVSFLEKELANAHVTHHKGPH